MLKPKHLIKKEKNDYRLIAISDIHGHLDRFKELLRKVKKVNHFSIKLLKIFI